MKVDRNRIKIIISMLIWGTIGPFVREINMSSIEIAFFRAIIGGVFIMILSLLMKEKHNNSSLLKNMPILLLSGFGLGIGWVLLFQGYKYTTISNATLSYYIAPIFITILSFIILKEKITLRKVLGIIGAMIGLIMILGVGQSEVVAYEHLKGILYSLAAAGFYAVVVISNKFIKDIPSYMVTIVQLFVASMVLFPVIIFKGSLELSSVDPMSWLLLLILGIIHTGLSYLLYFSAIKEVEGQSIALLSYFDPIFAVLISSIFLGEHMGLKQALGGALILASALLSEREKIIKE